MQKIENCSQTEYVTNNKETGTGTETETEKGEGEEPDKLAENGQKSAINAKIETQDAFTQTKTQWLQISLSSPPLSLQQEVPDVML